MLTAGSNVEWLRDDLGLIETAARSHDVASQWRTPRASCTSPLLGLGTRSGTTAPAPRSSG
jgi:glycerol kinase